MVEEADAGEGHGNAVFVARSDDMVVTPGTNGLGNVLPTALVCPFDVVAEAE